MSCETASKLTVAANDAIVERGFAGGIFEKKMMNKCKYININNTNFNAAVDCKFSWCVSLSENSWYVRSASHLQGPSLFTKGDTERKRGKKMFISNMLWEGKKRVCVCLCWGGFVTVTNFDRHIRLQKEHPARGWGHMVLPSAGVALDQVTTLARGSRLSQVYSFCPTLLNKNRRKNERGGLGGVEWVL